MGADDDALAATLVAMNADLRDRPASDLSACCALLERRAAAASRRAALLAKAAHIVERIADQRVADRAPPGSEGRA